MQNSVKGIVSSYSWRTDGIAYRWLEPGNFEVFYEAEEAEVYAHHTYLVPDDEDDLPLHNYVLKEMPSLFLEFAYLVNEDDYVTFANNYGGLLDYPDRVNGSCNLNTKRHIETEGKLTFGEPWGLWKYESRYLRQTFELWTWLREKDLAKLNLVVKWIHQDNRYVANCAIGDEEHLKAYRNEQIQTNNPNIEIVNLELGFASRIDKDDIFSPVQYLIQERVNLALENLRIHAALETDYSNTSGLIGILKPNDLLAAIWCQFYEAIAQEKKFKRCSVCGQWEDVTYKRITWSKHPNCAAKERTARYRAKSKS